MTIQRIQYEVTDRANNAILEACREYEAAVNEMDENRKAFMDEHGTSRGRPSRSMAIATLFFPEGEIPKGWKPCKKPGCDVPEGQIECVPDQRTAVGKRITKELHSDKFRVPHIGAVISAIGRGRHGGPTNGLVIEAGRLAWPRLLCLEVPEKRYILDLPMASNDTWTPPAGLVELRQSEFWRLIETHNDRQKAGRAAA